MIRMMRMLAATGALAACGAAGEDDTAPAARAPAEAAAPRTTDREVRVDSVAVGDFQFVLHRRASRVVDSVFVMRAGRRVQALVPSELEEHAILDDPTYRVDLDWDGHLDFALVTLVPAGPNTAFDYWRFDPAAGRFRYVGNYGMLEPDSTTRTLLVHSRDGHAGRLWTNVRYRWIEGRLVEVWANQQTFFDDIQRYAYRIYERRGDSLAVVSVDTLEDSEVEPRDDPEPGHEGSAR